METVRLKDALVEAMLPHAAFDGWSSATLEIAARDLDLDPTLPARLFPCGAVDAVAYLTALADRRMAEAMADSALDGLGLGEKVYRAVRLRLEPWSEHREAMRRAASLLSLPPNLALAGRLTWASVDAIWRAVGDASHDFSWYTKRLSLTAVYSATLLYWLDDPSEGCEDSWAFLRRRLNDVRNLPKLRQKVEGWVSGLKMPARRWGVPQR